MKLITSISWLVLAVMLSTSVVGCKKKPGRITRIPGSTPGAVGGSIGTDPLSDGSGVNSGLLDGSGIPASSIPLDQWAMSATQPWQGNPDYIVYFDFDKSSVRPSEVPKIESIANMMKNYPGKALRVEGHCDERGTEEYNRALGERRALSVREYLVQLGVNSQMIDTISYGEDRPADSGHTTTAWSQNRRGEFVLLDPPQ